MIDDIDYSKNLFQDENVNKLDMNKYNSTDYVNSPKYKIIRLIKCETLNSDSDSDTLS